MWNLEFFAHWKKKQRQQQKTERGWYWGTSVSDLTLNLKIAGSSSPAVAEVFFSVHCQKEKEKYVRIESMEENG